MVIQVFALDSMHLDLIFVCPDIIIVHLDIMIVHPDIIIMSFTKNFRAFKQE